MNKRETTFLPPDLYSLAGAAEYLGVHVETVKHHMYKRDRLAADHVISGALFFTQATLDAFRAKYQAEGFTMNEAAEYLGVNRSLVRYHVYESKKLAPDGKRYNSNIYKKETLDRFRREVLDKR